MGLSILKDNSRIVDSDKLSLVNVLANKDLAVLSQEGFLIFPQQLENSIDLDRDNYVFQQKNNETWTCNVAGVIADSESEIHITSRFTEDDKEDYFLQYMMQRVMNYNVVDSELWSSEAISYYDLLVYLFPYYLNDALTKGIYKEYVSHQYNDANVRGKVDFSRQIRSNVPFLGRIAYSTREFSYDNIVTELIRHTIEKIELDHGFVLTGNDEVKVNVRSIRLATDKYNRLDRQRIIQNNVINPVKSGYFGEYALLQQLCIKILHEDETGFGEDSEHVHGVIIDVAWLWEAYIWQVTGWKHYGRKSGLQTMNLYERLGFDSQQHRYPDFENSGVPVDTKYKLKLNKRDDYNQMITYMHLMDVKTGVFLQPTNDHDQAGYRKLGGLLNNGGALARYKFMIPQNCQNYGDFVAKMKQEEANLKELVLNV
jgi:5-methylcytosine-specific restriction endonuclease McrBC regulatory subunit McrC